MEALTRHASAFQVFQACLFGLPLKNRPPYMNPGPEASHQQESTSFVELLAWLEVNKKRLITVGAAGLGVAFVVYVYNYIADQKEARANEALLALNVSVTSQTNIPPAKSTDLLKVASDFAGTKTAERAAFLAATALYSEGKFAEAQAQFDSFQSRYAGSTLAASAAIGSAVALESQGKYNEALAAYQAIATRYPSSSVLNQSKFAVARLNEAKNNHPEAYRIYEELSKSTAYSAWVAEASQQKEQLAQRFPDLAKPKAPVVVSTNPPPAGAPPAPAK